MTLPFLSRRHALAGLAATGLIAGCGRSAGSETLKVGSQKGGTKALMLSSGVLEGVGYSIEWAEFPAAQNLLEAVGSGAVDVGLAGDAPFQFAYQSGLPIKAISAQRSDPRPSEAVAIVVPGDSPVRTIADLKGKRIATTRGSIGYYLALRALHEAGLTPDAVHFIWLTPGDTRAAFASRTIDAWACWTPYSSTAIAEGARVVADGQNLIHGYVFEVANEQAIATKRTILADFLQREAKALDWATAHPAGYAKVLAAETGLPPDIALIMVRKNSRHAVPISPAVIEDQRIVLDTFGQAGEIKPARPLDQAFAVL
ncbi:ABC transporter substrate-binding protein [Sphingobium sp. WCS2017Hpa-17]|uniref:ABC transporter substrate-binding protein n=1 Tax=Sphingobium sp. WCS2017Hpa-17 TaxID=3073638 RepID=UPI00288C4FFF|nr:ABC transporter substrate-binding protein [Sphingobium sp. WCS2017Hpa-17]